MYAFLTIIMIIISALIILVVLVQNPKGGGLGAGFGGGGGSLGGGVQKTTDFLEKATWGLAIAFLALCIVSTIFITSGNNNNIGAPDSSTEIYNPIDE